MDGRGQYMAPPTAATGGAYAYYGQQQGAYGVPPRAAAVFATTAPLPSGWSEHVTPQGMRYYYNTATGVSTYERPSAPASRGAPVAAVAQASAAPQAAAVSAATAWNEYKDPTSGQSYYYNSITRATTWEMPEEYRIQQARAQVEQIQSTVAAVEGEVKQRREQKKRDADEKYTRELATMTKEDRIVSFKQFLEEKNVSPQFKWQELLRFLGKEGLDQDPRWTLALTTVGEKKQAFSEYCTQVVNKQNIERRRQAKVKREDFLALLGSIEDKVLAGRKAVSWEDVNQGAEFYGLRKDARWAAIEDAKERKDLFDTFVQDVERKRVQEELKAKEEFKTTFISRLRACQSDTAPIGSLSLTGKRRLDSELKKQVWTLAEQMETTTQRSVNLQKHEVYTWTEDFLEVLRAEESEQLKADREQRKAKEEALTKALGSRIGEWLEADKIGLHTPWTDASSLIADEVATLSSEGSAELSERRQRRVYEKTMKAARAQIQGAADTVSELLKGISFSVDATTTYEAMASAVIAATKQGHLSDSDGDDQEDVALRRALLELVADPACDPSQTVTLLPLPRVMRRVYELLVLYSSSSRHDDKRSSRSRSPHTKRKRRHSSIDSPSRRDRSRSRSRSRSHSRDPRSSRVVATYANLPISSPKRARHEAGSSTSSALVQDESVRAEEIIRQARLKMLQKDDATQSEPEEGEEVEDGEVLEE